MKRLLGFSMSTCPSAEEEEEKRIEERGRKKRGLSNEQVKALEKHFEVDNKLEAYRKVKLARELGLQPRQVAIWFQNRLVRWKTKQLERDFGILKSDYDSLKLNCVSLQGDNDALLSEIKKLKNKLNEESRDTEHLTDKEERILPETEKLNTPIGAALDSTDLMDNEKANNFNILIFHDTKEGSIDYSDSSAVHIECNGNNSPIAAISSSASVQTPNQISPTPFSSFLPSLVTSFQFSDSRLAQDSNGTHKAYRPQHYVKLDEHNFFNADESCNFFSDEQASSMNWFCPDQCI